MTLIVFSDFQCPACRMLAQRLERARAKWPNDIRLIYRHYPLTTMHPLAFTAAVAAECAAAQQRFVAYHDILFKKQDSIGSLSWTAIAVNAGVADTTTFATCMSSERATALVREDSLAGVRLRVTGTPAVILNQWRFSDGAPSEETLERMIKQELATR